MGWKEHGKVMEMEGMESERQGLGKKEQMWLLKNKDGTTAARWGLHYQKGSGRSIGSQRFAISIESQGVYDTHCCGIC